MATDARILVDQGLCLQFKDVSYTVAEKNGGKPKQILHNVNGQFHSGQLTAILGPSGAGKTSLLNVLSGFKTKGVSGAVKVNGSERNVDEFRRQSCYISQDQSMLPQLTSRETLMVAANLKLRPGWEKRQDTSSVVTNILEVLGLTSTENTSVESLSGGEKKRLSIGLELITNPPIMFVDEPTSGLDSSSSNQVITHLQALSANGHIVVCVVHQPSSRMVHKFDHLYLMGDGQCLYSGATANLVSVFQDANFFCPQYYNLADFAIEVACRERGDDLSSLLRMFGTGGQYSTEANETSLMLPTESLLGKTLVYDSEHTISNKFDVRMRYPTSKWRQFDVLLRRSLRCTMRDLHMALMRFGVHIAVGFLLGIIYYNFGNEASKVDSNAACLFFFLLFLFYSNAVHTVMTFPIEMAVLLREHLNNWYSLAAYYWAKLLTNIPLQVLCPVSFLLLGYYLSNQPAEMSRMLMTLLPCMLIVLTAQGLGMVLGAACDIQMGVFLVPVTTLPMVLFSGFFLRLDDIPVYLRWVAQVSYFKHGFEAMVIAVYGFDRANLDCSQPYCRHKDPDTMLRDFDMDQGSYWHDIAGLVTWIVILHAAVFGVLKWRIHTAK